MEIIGHAGARGLAPENTTSAIKKALEYRVDAIEFDVRVTKDCIPVLCHNPDLIDSKHTRLPIATTSLSTLRRQKPDLATLEAAIRIVNRTVPLHIEVKSGVTTQPIIQVVERFLDIGWQPSDFFFASFDQRTLLALKNAFPTCGMIVLENWSGVRARKRACQLETKLLSMNQRWLWRPFIRPTARAGYRLFAYTVNNPKQAHRWAPAGLEGVVTDFPDRFL